MMNTNEKLFFYGLWANCLIGIGGFLIIISIVIYLFSKYIIIIPIILFLLGLFIFFKGKAKRLDYKMKSGYIVHQGDN